MKDYTNNINHLRRPVWQTNYTTSIMKNSNISSSSSPSTLSFHKATHQMPTTLATMATGTIMANMANMTTSTKPTTTSPSSSFNSSFPNTFLVSKLSSSTSKSQFSSNSNSSSSAISMLTMMLILLVATPTTILSSPATVAALVAVTSGGGDGGSGLAREQHIQPRPQLIAPPPRSVSSNTLQRRNVMDNLIMMDDDYGAAALMAADAEAAAVAAAAGGRGGGRGVASDLEEEAAVGGETADVSLPKCSSDPTAICGFMQLNMAGLNKVPICSCPQSECRLWLSVLDAGRIVKHGNDFYKYCVRKPELHRCQPNQLAYVSYGKMDLITGMKLEANDELRCLCPSEDHILKTNRTLFEMTDTAYVYGSEQICQKASRCTRKQYCSTITETMSNTIERKHCRCTAGKYCPKDIRLAHEIIKEDKGTVYNMRCI